MTTANSWTQDDTGQWWFTFRDGRRIREKVLSCEECHEDFRSWKPQRFCSVACRAAAREVLHAARLCAQCRAAFVPIVKTQRYCSHTCAATAYHAKQRVTTAAAGGPIKNTDNPRYCCDEQGQWWYTPTGSPRTRAHIKVCVACGERFLSNIFHRRRQGTCSKSCGRTLFHQQNPGAYAREKSGRWKGGRKYTGNGYIEVLMPEHPSLRGRRKRYVPEHRLVMEKMIGRYLEAHETVHHKNGIRDDNRPKNLELWASNHPPGQRVEEQGHCPTCTCFAVTTNA